MSVGGVFILCSLCCGTRTKNVRNENCGRAVRRLNLGQSKNVQERTCSPALTASSCRRTSRNFLLSSVLSADEPAGEKQQQQQQQAAKTQITTSLILSDHRRMLFRSFSGHADCRLAFYTHPWEDRKTTSAELESSRNWRE